MVIETRPIDVTAESFAGFGTLVPYPPVAPFLPVGAPGGPGESPVTPPACRRPSSHGEGGDWFSRLAVSRMPERLQWNLLVAATLAAAPVERRVFRRFADSPVLMLPLDEPVVLLVGLPGTFEPAPAPAAWRGELAAEAVASDRLRAFRLPRGATVVIEPGVWWADPIVAAEAWRVLVAAGARAEAETITTPAIALPMAARTAERT